MNILVNGNVTSVADNCSIADLLAELQVDKRYCAVECNRKVIPREQHADCRLNSDDQIEIVTLVGGG